MIQKMKSRSGFKDRRRSNICSSSVINSGSDIRDGKNDKKVLEGPPAEILQQLEVFAANNSIKTDQNKLMPKSPNVLTRRLNQIRSNLGISVVIFRNTTGKNKNTSTIKIWKISPLRPLPPLRTNSCSK
jgi:hypothetical protein